MFPNLKNSEKVSVVKILKPTHDSVIIFDAHGIDSKAINKDTYYVKRVIGIPGDKITYTKSGKLFINGKLKKQSYISKTQQKSGTLNPINTENTGFTLAKLAKNEHWNKQVSTIPNNYYFVMGDNRVISNDSRYWGLVPKDKIMGVVKVPFWDKNKSAIN
jgi:signal peptidase I